MKLTEKIIDQIAQGVSGGLDWQSSATMAGATRPQFLDWIIAGNREPASIEGDLVFALEAADAHLKAEMIANVKKSAAGRKWLRKRQHTGARKRARKVKVNIVMGGKS